MISDENPQQQTNLRGRRITHIKQWIILGVIVALILLFAVVAVFWWVSQKSSSSHDSSSPAISAARICSKDVVHDANVPLTNSDQIALAPVVDKIKKLKDFDHDPNCMYIVLQYDLGTGDAIASRADLNKYDQIYDPFVGLSDAFTVSIMPIEELRNNVAFLEQSAKEGKVNEQKDAASLSSGSDAADKFHQEHK